MPAARTPCCQSLLTPLDPHLALALPTATALVEHARVGQLHVLGDGLLAADACHGQRNVRSGSGAGKNLHLPFAILAFADALVRGAAGQNSQQWAWSQHIKTRRCRGKGPIERSAWSQRTHTEGVRARLDAVGAAKQGLPRLGSAHAV